MTSSRRWRSALFLTLLAASLFGLGVSAWTHVLALRGGDPGPHFKPFWLFQLLLLALTLPILGEVFLKHGRQGFPHVPRWARYGLYVMVGYYGINFYFFLYWSADHLSSSLTWRMFSAGWLLLFSVAAVFYGLRMKTPPT